MNKISSSLAVVILTFGFFGCNSGDDGLDVNDSNEIRLTAGVKSLSLRSSLGPLDKDFTVDFPIGIYAYNVAWKAGATNLISNKNATVKGTASHDVTFENSTVYYYPTDGLIVEFRAFAPQGTESAAATAGTAPKVNIVINGHDDVMFAKATGFKAGSAPASNPVLNFDHLLTQLRFTLKTDQTYTSTVAKVVSLKLKQQPSIVTLDVEEGDITFGSTNLIDMEAITANSQTGIGSVAVDTRSPLMTRPGASYSLEVVVQPDPADAAKTVTYDATITADGSTGVANMITLTFTAKGITATATVADWITGDGGSVIL